MTEASATGCRAPASATFMTTVTVTTAAMTAAAMNAVMTTETAITAGMTDASVSMGHMTVAATTALTTAGDETTGAAAAAAAAGTITDKRAGEVTGTTTGAAAAAVVVDGTETTGTEVMTGPEDDFCFFVNNYFEALVNCCTCIKLLIMQPVSIQAYTSHPLCSVLNIYLLK